jgi:hypothetical protein
MKVKLTIELDVPDNIILSEENLEKMIYDNYINYVTKAHRIDVMKSLKKIDESVTALKIYDIHNNWVNISEKAIWKFEKIKN